MFPPPYICSLFDAYGQTTMIPLWIFSPNGTLLFSSITHKHLSKVHESVFFDSPITSGIECQEFYFRVPNEREVHFHFYAEIEGSSYYFLCGPIFTAHPLHQSDIQKLSFSSNLSEIEVRELICQIPVVDFHAFCCNIRFCMLYFAKKAPSSSALIELLNDCCKKFNSNLELTMKIFFSLEDQQYHTSYKQERELLNNIRTGNMEHLPDMLNYPFEPGILSSTVLKQRLYEFICSITLVTRAAVEGGLDEETAYSLSDIYIRRADTSNSTVEIANLLFQAHYDFTRRVKESQTNTLFCPAIESCIEYIHKHLHEKLTLKTLAKTACLSEKYLSRLFVKETGQTISGYICQKRMDEAKNLLVYSDFSFSEISNYLCFNSQSYFISVFREYTGFTPKEYRKKYGKHYWDIHS